MNINELFELLVTHVVSSIYLNKQVQNQDGNERDQEDGTVDGDDDDDEQEVVRDAEHVAERLW